MSIASGIRTMSSVRKACLYEQLLGPEFWSLPPTLREFHRRGGRASGVLRVERGRSRIARALATRLSLPRAGDGVPVELHVAPLANGEHWVRYFDGVRFETCQRSHKGLLVEQAGPWWLIFRMTASASGLQFRQVGLRALGVPVPMLLSPRTAATATECDGGWRIKVRLEAPLIGLICAYEGELVPA